MEVEKRKYHLNLKKRDVLVFLHIQKTGGSHFGGQLVTNLNITSPCVCPNTGPKVDACSCITSNKKKWLFSRYSTGWPCGVHADWTELQNCVGKEMDRLEGLHRKRRFHYITILREPVIRYISEWKQVQRIEMTWPSSLFCDGRKASSKEVPSCYTGQKWKNITFENFVGCKSNLAINRQTRMLANLSSVNCYNTTGMSFEERQTKILKSALENLKNMAFFGLTEYQLETQLLFEMTFDIRFKHLFEQHTNTYAENAIYNLTEAQISKIKQLNDLDIKLYEFAKK
ncbi:LOW QUALITY PROTEIN: heparan-sulfate 6-O-sulfotransferase 3-B-like, partial [Mytilus californianus]|uniref:LOW QUALITY PROTEIN: heparan-sulfate 6-O-sulfotransferase 3-B-like n=1 Tax=Mytilus californianus TaxID=6549 RepID=UPI0022475BBD